jgi:very-short-patch-repair endonuclease
VDGTKRTASLNHRIGDLAGQQHGVVSRRQLRALGIGDSTITLRIASGYLRPLFRETFAVGHVAITRQGQTLAAVLACDEGTVLSHGSAAELLGLWEKRLPVVHVIPPDWSGRKIDGIRWHRVRLPDADEIEIRDGIPCTTVSRTLVDMAGSMGWSSMRRLVEQAAILRQLDVEEIDRILSLGRRRGAPRLRRILAPWRATREERPVVRSRLEARLLPLLIEEGLPAPRTNVKLNVDGHRFEVDLLWGEQRLAVETDGEETHGTQAAFQRDRWRDQLLVAAGYRTSRITWAQVRDEPDAVVNRIARMLKAV